MIPSQQVWSFFSLQDNQTNLRLSKLNTKLAHANTNLSVEMKKDSSQMRSIALLTMVFLPMSTVAVCHNPSTPTKGSILPPVIESFSPN